MNKIEFHIPSRTYRVVKYGKRYGYWWKKHREIARGVSVYHECVDYFYNLEYTLDIPMSNKHFKRWLRKDVYNGRYDK